MPKVPVYDMNGSQTGEIELSDRIFDVEVNQAVVHLAVKRQLANQRLGTHATKTRAQVRGGGRKPWRQKGTGRARVGSIRSPLWVGGGTVFGPRPRSYELAMPRKARRLAIKSALTAKVRTGGLRIMESLSFVAPKTRDVVKMLTGFGVAGSKSLLVTAVADEVVEKSSRNIPGVKSVNAGGLSVIDLLHHDYVFITRDAVEKIEEVLG
ncbi:MAG: 50S ribosomal protein L4 [Negativicutes bacterium]|nr:50S ribosomal protein L4 [Negativicutes bacterium]